MPGVVLSYAVGVAQREAEATGWYLPHEVGQLAGVSGDQIGQWARRGYMQSAWAERSPRAYAYQDVAEAMVLHYLRLNQVPYRSIRKALAKAREVHGLRWPLSNARLYIVADHPQRKGPKRTVVVDGFDVVKEHPVIGSLDLVEVKRELMRGGWAFREDASIKHVAVNPALHSGTPVVRGTRVPVMDVAELAAVEGGRKILRDDYGLSPVQVDDAVKWAERVRSYEARSLDKAA
jgi:uncharacterized protein (DUF433 family)/DNA-binding transcriptional MerR regulator